MKKNTFDVRGAVITCDGNEKRALKKIDEKKNNKCDVA